MIVHPYPQSIEYAAERGHLWREESGAGRGLEVGICGQGNLPNLYPLPLQRRGQRQSRSLCRANFAAKLPGQNGRIAGG